MNPIVVTCMILCMSVPSLAQNSEPAISTERPSVGLTADLVPPGTWQMESGITSAHGEHFELHFPETFLRLGISNRLEARFMASNSHVDGTGHLSREDMALSAKVRLPGLGPGASSAVIVGVNLPSGSGDLTSSGFDPSVSLAWSKPLKARLALTGSGTWSAISTPGDGMHTFNQQYSAVVGWNLTSSQALFGEFAPSRSSSSIAYGYTIDGGYTLALRRTFQIDARLGVTNAAGTSTFLWGVGYSIRHRAVSYGRK